MKPQAKGRIALMHYRVRQRSYLVTAFGAIELLTAFHWPVFSAATTLLAVERVKGELQTCLVIREVLFELF